MPSTNDIDGALFEQLRPRLKAISARIVGSEAEAEDIVQDCFFKWHSAERHVLATPAAWLTTVVQHLSIDRLRQRARDVLAAEAASELSPAASPLLPEEVLLRRAALGQALARLLAGMSPSERLALVLHEVYECSHADIAALLDTKAVNARQHLARARRRLQDQQGETPPEAKLNHELVHRFQLAINGMDMPAMLTLLTGTQPTSVCANLRPRPRACANDACYTLAA
ncbi:sigma-70 family RNA polymerase sigma factor [Duganella callida]|nr:sigma-70 family RNA polymerase sigma factor [Duganella callida]